MEFTDLNKQQLEAVNYVEGPLLVLAGAGSGKTRVLTTRIANLITNHGVWPSEILALTFTNKAAREMRERTERIVGSNVDDMWIATFHSCCARILRYEAEHLGFDKRFVIYDSADQLTLYQNIIKQLQLDDKRFPKRLLRERVSDAKNHAINVEEYLRDGEFSDTFIKVYRLYQKRLKESNALDFDDLLLKVTELFGQNSDVLSKYQRRFRFILVDEYQDTNMVQYNLLRMLAAGHGNLCVVGDDDQSIYGWRGADIKNILGFEKDFKGAHVIRLEQNYRSTSVILDAANSVIENNKGRKKKKLWTDEAGGERVRLYTALDERDEANYICRNVLEGVRNGGNYDDYAILYRTNAQSRMIETAFMGFGIPYKVYGGLRFYERSEIKDIMAYLRVVFNAADDVAFMRIVNTPKRGLGAAALEGLSAYASEAGLPLMLAAIDEEGLPTRLFSKLEPFTKMMTDFIAMRESMSLELFIKELLRRINYEAYLRDDKKENYETKLENINEMLGAVSEFEAGLPDDVDVLGAYLENVSLISDIDGLNEDDGSVALMTMHSAKGLEFPTVFIAGMEEGIFPSAKSKFEPEKLEEERRLCYVGITRACSKLYLISAQRRMLYGDILINMPSRFLGEIPDELVEKESAVSEIVLNRAALKEAAEHSFREKAHGSFGKLRSYDHSGITPKSDNNEAKFKQYQQVNHAVFGMGTVLSVEGSGSAEIVVVEFGGGTIKKFAASFAPITIVE